jgi:hypothetical protein
MYKLGFYPISKTQRKLIKSKLRRYAEVEVIQAGLPESNLAHLNFSIVMWSSYDRTWFCGPDRQEILIHSHAEINAGFKTGSPALTPTSAYHPWKINGTLFVCSCVIVFLGQIQI